MRNMPSTRARAIAISRNGDPEVLEWVEIDLPPPAAHEVRVRRIAIGQNFSDIDLRNGGFYVGSGLRLPIVLGNEAAGIVEAVGRDVEDFLPGDRVAYTGVDGMFCDNTGASAQVRIVPATHVVRLPEWISDQQAAGMLRKGLTPSGIVHRCFRPASGDAVLIHAAASGVGKDTLIP